MDIKMNICDYKFVHVPSLKKISKFVFLSMLFSHCSDFFQNLILEQGFKHFLSYIIYNVMSWKRFRDASVTSLAGMFVHWWKPCSISSSLKHMMCPSVQMHYNLECHEWPVCWGKNGGKAPVVAQIVLVRFFVVCFIIIIICNQYHLINPSKYSSCALYVTTILQNQLHNYFLELHIRTVTLNYTCALQLSKLTW